MAETPAELLVEAARTIPGHGSVVFKVFDTRSKKATIVKAKLQSKELQLQLDASNEEDITSQFKLKRATKEFANAILDRCNVVFRDGELKVDFDWNGIRRIQQEAAIRAQKLAEKKQRDEEEKIAKEKRIQEEKIAEQARIKAQQEEEARRIQAAKDAEVLRLKREQEQREFEANQRRRAFEDKIGNAILNGGVLSHVPKRNEGLELESKDDNAAVDIVKTWSDEHRAFYFTDTNSNELTWRDPRINSVWDKLWDGDMKAFKFVNKQTNEVIWQEPYTNRVEKIWVEEESKWYYVNRETGDTDTNEPYY